MQGFAYNAFAHVYLDYPYGGETFQGNTIITLEWHIAIPHNQLNWDLYFSTDGGNSWQPIQLDLPVSQTTYSWVVPSIATSTARISVIQDNTEMDYQDESMNFTIVPEPNMPFIEITAQDINLDCHVNDQQAAIDQWLNIHGGAIAEGFCGDLVWSHDFDGLTNECGATGISFVTFRAEDECGYAETGAYVRVFDFASPAIETPASNLVVECSGNNNFTQLYNWLNNHGGAIASDACSNVTWTNNYSNLSNDCSTTGNATVIFIATDACGNSSTTSAIFSIEDNTAPAISTPAQQNTISCTVPNAEEILQDWLQSHGGATAADACGNVTWSDNYSGLNDGCGTTGSASVIFTATDDCGNSSTTSADFVIQDNMMPQISIVARDTIMNCDNPNVKTDLVSWLDNHGGAVATDMCGTVSWTNDFPVLTDTCDITTSFSVTFTVIDECNNRDTTVANITLQVATVSTDIPTSEFDVKIFPNPASDVLHIRLDKKLTYPVHLSVFDARAQNIFSTIEYSNDFDLSVDRIQPGIYFLQVETSDGTIIKRVVIH